VNRRIAVLAAAVLAAAFLFLLLPLPPRQVLLPVGSPIPDTPSGPRAAVTGAFHIHTRRSDGSGTPDEIAAAASSAQLRFIILTDHGDGTRAPDPPQYRSGVLVIDAVELSTQGGHYIALGLPQAPYPLRGEARDVVEDVRRLGGFGIVAHADSAKPGLQWLDWNAPFDAMEWLNADTEWRDEERGQLVRALARYPFRPVETLGSLLDRPERTLERWDTLTQSRRVVGIAGADAHARAGWRDDDANGYRHGWFLSIPTYQTSFRAFSTTVTLDRALTGDANADAAAILSGIRDGRVLTTIDALARPAHLELTKDESASTFIARSNAPRDAMVVLRRDGRIVAEHAAPELSFEASEQYGTYRAEVHLPHAPGDPPVPWIVGNPIYVRPDGWGTTAPAAPLLPTITLGIQGGPWHAETDGASTAQAVQTEPPKGPAEFNYRLADGARAGQYAALVIAVGKALTERTHLAIRAHASRPMRVSVQARQPQSGERWQRSIYLDSEVRDLLVPLGEMWPIGTSGAFDPGTIDTLLFVVDLTNANPGTTGGFTIHDLRIER
jgi:hypothetical protein